MTKPPANWHETPAFWHPILEMQSALIAFVRGLVGETELARDITQDAYVDAWGAALRHVPPFDTPDDLTSIRRWLFTVAYRHALKHMRRRQSITWESLDEQSPTEAAQPPTPSFEDAVAEAEALRVALLGVAPEDAACFLLQAVHGFSTAEIATILDVRPDAIRKRLSRARQRLRDAYNAQTPAQTQQPQPHALDAHEGQR